MLQFIQKCTWIPDGSARNDHRPSLNDQTSLGYVTSQRYRTVKPPNELDRSEAFAPLDEPYLPRISDRGIREAIMDTTKLGCQRPSSE
jgi:hypothetical protein